VTAIRELAGRGIGSKTIAREVGVAHNAVRRLLAEQEHVTVSDRTVQRAVADLLRQQRTAALATVRVETAPGDQLQIDFGLAAFRLRNVHGQHRR
jgi:hypothetical protein